MKNKSTLSKDIKLEIFSYYVFGTKCACGKPKLPMHWICAPCKAIVWPSPQAHALRDACEIHTTSAAALLDHVTEIAKVGKQP